jgi:hypothetical protein
MFPRALGNKDEWSHGTTTENRAAALVEPVANPTLGGPVGGVIR